MIKRLLLSVVALSLGGALLQAEDMKATSGANTTAVTVLEPVISPEMIKYAVSSERRMIFEAAMEDLLMSPTDAAAFWEVYAGYEMDKAEVGMKRLEVVGEYVKNFTTMSDTKVKELLKSSYKVQSQELKLRKKYAGKLTKKVNATVAGRFWQVDDFIPSAVKLSLLANAPLLGEDIR
jgi:hypothetical protein